MGNPGLSFIAGLATLNRMDTVLLYLPVLAFVLLSTRNFKALGAIALGFLPFIIWECFATIYYGFPFPNTAYAKLNTGIQSSELLLQGLWYLLESLQNDPATLLVILGGISIPVLSREWRHLPIALGLILYMLYVVRIGGCFMSGRFLSLPFLGAVILISASNRIAHPKVLVPALIAIALCGVLSSHPPVLSGSTFARDRENIRWKSVTDERRFYYGDTGLLRENRQDNFEPNPNWPSRIKGKEWRQNGSSVRMAGAIGANGYYAGPQIYIVDNLALPDALLARMPARYQANWMIGHYPRTLPEGYIESIESGENAIADAKLAHFSDKLAVITKGPIWRRERLIEIARMNLGAYDDLIDFDAYRYPKMQRWPLDDLATSQDGIRVGPEGAAIELGALSQAEELRILMKEPVAFEIGFLNNGEVLHKKMYYAAESTDRKQGDFHIVAPNNVIRTGYDTLRIFPRNPLTIRQSAFPCHLLEIELKHNQ